MGGFDEVLDVDEVLDCYDADCGSIVTHDKDNVVDDICKPERNEMYYRFQSFLKGGPRKVIPPHRSTHSQTDGSLMSRTALSPPEPTSGALRASSSSTAKPAGSNAAIGRLAVGTQVRIHSLQAKPELNGQLATVATFDSTSDRYEVVLHAGGPSKRVRRINLDIASENPIAAASEQAAKSVAGGPASLVPGMLVHVTSDARGITEGTLVEYDKDKNRWLVLLGDGVSQFAQPEHLKPVVCVADVHSAEGSSRKEDGALHPAATDLEFIPPKILEITVGAWVRIHGLSVRPELNGQEGVVRDFVEGAGRWSIEVDGSICRLRANNLEVLSGGNLRTPHVSKLKTHFASMGSAALVLDLCLQKETSLTVPDVTEALQRIRCCPDRGVICADSRLLALLAVLREKLLAEAVPQELSKLLEAMRDFDLRSMPLLQALGERVSHHVFNFTTRDLVQVITAFAALGHADIQLLDTLSREVKRRAPQFAAMDIVRLAEAFAALRLRNFEMFDELAVLVSAQVSELKDEDFVRLVRSCADLEILDGDLLETAAAEATKRAMLLSLDDLVAVCNSLARVNYPLVERALRDLSQAVAAQVPLDLGATTHERSWGHKIEKLSLQPRQVLDLVDSLPSCCPAGLRERLGLSLLPRSRHVGRILSLGLEPSQVLDLRGFLDEVGGDLGIVCTRWALEGMNVPAAEPSFVQRAVNRISWELSKVEDWTLLTAHVRSFACAEWELPATSGVSADKGYCVQHSRVLGETPSEISSSSLLTGLLTQRLVLQGELCVLCETLCKLDNVLRAIPEVCPRAQMNIFLSKPPGVAGLVALSHFRTLWDELTLAVAVGAQSQTVSNLSAADVEAYGNEDEDEEEVIDVDLGENPLAEDMERVD